MNDKQWSQIVALRQVGQLQQKWLRLCSIRAGCSRRDKNS
jgi:hypothetical protein